MTFKEKAIENIIDNFDFNRVHDVMTFLNWSYFDSEGVPSIGRLVTSAQKRLSEAYDKCNETKTEHHTGSGGFFVHADYNNETETCDYLHLKFQLTSWEYYEK